MGNISKHELVEILDRIADRMGRLTPDAVVEAASEPEHPLHNRFEWNDTIAAHSNRLATARRLIAYAQVKVRHHKVTLSAPAYVRDPQAAPGQQGYRSVMFLRSDDENARAAILAEMERVRSILRRTRSLVLVLGREADLDDLERAVEGFVASVSTEPGPEAPSPLGAS